MSKTERRWCWLTSAVLIFITAVPYALAFLRAGESWTFSGFLFGVEDGNSYIAKMLLGSEGSWLFTTPYTGEPQTGVVAFLPYLLIGKLFRPPALHFKLVMAFHLFRLAGIPVLVFSLYRFASVFLKAQPSRRWVTGLAAVGGGLGWLVPFLGQTTWLDSLPLEFYSPETFGFLSILGLPHLIFARAFLLDALRLYLKAGKTPARGFRAGVMLVLVALLQPMTAMVALAVIGAHLLVLAGRVPCRADWERWFSWVRTAAETVLLPLPLLAYLSFSFLLDPFLSAWTSQNRLDSPHPLHYLLAYGALIPVVVAGARIQLRRDEDSLLPLAWVLLLPLLAYAPVTVQRRLPEGIWVAMLVLAAVGIDALRNKDWLRRVYVALLLPSTILLLAGSLQTAYSLAEPVFHPDPLVRSFTWAAEHMEKDALVLTAYETGNILPSYASVRVVIGHGPESINLDTLLPQVSAVYQGSSGVDVCSWLAEHEVDYVYDGPYEAALGQYDFSSLDCLGVFHRQDNRSIFEVRVP